MNQQTRNEPCACGSGKKYKKCHYLIAHENQERYYAEMRERARVAAEADRAKREELIRKGYSVQPRRRPLATLALMAAAVLSGCSYFYVDYTLHGIPNYQEVDANIIRGGQPESVEACLYLRDVKHVTKWIKYSYEREASSKLCEAVGIDVLHFEMPPSDSRDFVARPALAVVKGALAALLACRANHEVCFEGCLHGRDRTGLMTSLYLWISGEMDKATAWIYGAVDRGLRVFFRELIDTYEDFQP